MEGQLGVGMLWPSEMSQYFSRYIFGMRPLSLLPWKACATVRNNELEIARLGHGSLGPAENWSEVEMKASMLTYSLIALQMNGKFSAVPEKELSLCLPASSFLFFPPSSWIICWCQESWVIPRRPTRPGVFRSSSVADNGLLSLPFIFVLPILFPGLQYNYISAIGLTVPYRYIPYLGFCEVNSWQISQ